MKVSEHRRSQITAASPSDLEATGEETVSGKPNRLTEEEFVSRGTPDDFLKLQATDQFAKSEYRSYQQLVERTIDVFGDSTKASLWLSQPSPDFGGKVPLQVAQSVHYAAVELEELFEPIFIRIEHGIYW